MMHTLALRAPPPLRVDSRSLLPELLCTLGREDVLRLPLAQGREAIAVGDCFAVASASDDGAPRLRLEGELARFDAVGAGMAAGVLEVHGSVGDGAGLGMGGGELRVHGSARDLVACAMTGGTLEVTGDIGDFAASARPGESYGMRGGTLVVHGSAGERLGDRMRRGTVVVHGDTGDFLASRLVAGTIALGGRCGAHAGWGMRRGSLVFAGPAPQPAATFVAVHADMQVTWQLLARELARFGGRLEGLARRPVARWVGDAAVRGQGEWLLPQ